MTGSGGIRVDSLEEFRGWVAGFSRGLRKDEIVLLSGPLGAGKTEFVKTLASALGIPGVASPTFALHHAMPGPGFTLDHFDLFRLESEDELESAGLWDILQTPSLVVVEWPERVPAAHWPRDRVLIEIRIDKLSETGREIFWRRRG